MYHAFTLCYHPPYLIPQKIPLILILGYFIIGAGPYSILESDILSEILAFLPHKDGPTYPSEGVSTLLLKHLVFIPW